MTRSSPRLQAFAQTQTRARTASPASEGAARSAGDLFAGYRNNRKYQQAYDEMFAQDGTVRAPYKGLHSALAPSDAEDLESRAEALGRAFVDQGITFSLSGQERPFPLDLVPRVIAAA